MLRYIEIIINFFMKKIFALLFFSISVMLISGAGCSQTYSDEATNESTSGAEPKNIAIKTFEVTGESFKFSPVELRVSRGDTVKINFKNVQGFHDFVIDEFAVKTPQINAEESASLEFIADKAGIFEYYCSVGNHRAMGMVGKLIVE